MSDNLDIERLKKTKFYKGWTRFNCLNKGYVVPDWAREPDESAEKKRWIDEHNRRCEENGNIQIHKGKRAREGEDRN